MKTNDNREKNQTLISEYKDVKYFCPLPLCRTLFKDIHNDHKIIVKKQNYEYQCKYCKQYFNRTTYRDKAKCGKPYRILETIKFTKDDYIKSQIGDLWDKGYSNEEIHIITHFSKTLIGKITTEYWNNVVDICTREDFIKTYLGELDDYCKNKEIRTSEQDLRKHKVRKLSRLGAGVPQIAMILKMGNTTIDKDRRMPYIAENIIQGLNNENIIQDLNNKVKDRKEVLTADEEDLLSEMKQFLKKAEPRLSNSKTNTIRSRIKYDLKTGYVRVFARKKIISSPHTD